MKVWNKGVELAVFTIALNEDNATDSDYFDEARRLAVKHKLISAEETVNLKVLFVVKDSE